MKMRKNRCATVVGSFAVILAAKQAMAAIVVYNFDASTAVPTTLDTNVTATNVITTKGSTISYAGGNPAAGKAISTTGFNGSTPIVTNPSTINGFQFSVTPNAGYSLALSSFSFDDQASGTGPTTWELAYSTDNKSTWNVVGSAGSTHAAIATGNNSLTFTGLSNVTSQIYFDIFAAGGAAAGTGTWRVDNVTVNGTSTLAGVNNDTVITAVNSSVNYGRIVAGGTSSVLVNKTGTQTTTYSVTPTGGLAASNGSIAAGTQSNLGLTVNNGTALGAISGSLVIANTAANSAAAGQGSADPNDTVSYTATVLQNRQVGDTSATSPKQSLITLGKVMIGATATGTGNIVTSGTDDQNTRITLLGGQTSTFSSGGNSVTLNTPATDTVFNSATSTAAVTGSGSFSTAGAKTSSFVQMVDSTSTSTSSVAKVLVAEAGVSGQTVKSGNVYFSANVFSSSNASFGSTADTNTQVIDFGTVNQGDLASSAYSIYNLLGTVAGFTAGLDLLSTGGSSTTFSTGLTPGALVADGATTANNFYTATATMDTSVPGTYDVVYTLNVADDQTIAGAAANSTPLTLELVGTVVAVPEPVSLTSLVGAGSLMLLRRRRVAR